MTEPDTDGNPPQSTETITAGQAADLEAKADEIGIDKPKFLKYLKVKEFSEIPQANHREAVRLLKDKEEAG